MSTACVRETQRFPLGRLLERIRDFPFLYDRRCPEFRDTVLKDNRLQIIAAEFGISNDECKKKWRNARDRYTRIRQKLDATRRSGAVGKAPYWRHYGLLDSMIEDNLQGNSAHITDALLMSGAPAIANAWSICMETDGIPEIIEGASNSTAGLSSGSASCDDEYSEEVPQSQDHSYNCNGGPHHEIVAKEEIFNGEARHRDQSSPGSRAAFTRRKPVVGPSTRSQGQGHEPPDIDPLARSVTDALETCTAALNRLGDKRGHQRQDDCVDIEANWIASKLKIFPPSHRCRVAHKIHCLLHEEEMKLYD